MVTRFFWITIIFIAVWVGPTLAHELSIFLDPRGSDSSDGLSDQTPVTSLQEAIRIADLVADKDVSRIRIAVVSGEFQGQAAKAGGNIAGFEIARSAADPDQPRPRFNGDRYGGTWLDIWSATGKRTNYKISGLEITNYATAINFAGDRNHGERSNGWNEMKPPPSFLTFGEDIQGNCFSYGDDKRFVIK